VNLSRGDTRARRGEHGGIVGSSREAQASSVHAASAPHPVVRCALQHTPYPYLYLKLSPNLEPNPKHTPKPKPNPSPSTR
jgi:hypothetical protein